jgi:hypothetical protein
MGSASTDKGRPLGSGIGGSFHYNRERIRRVKRQGPVRHIGAPLRWNWQLRENLSSIGEPVVRLGSAKNLTLHNEQNDCADNGNHENPPLPHPLGLSFGNFLS